MLHQDRKGPIIVNEDSVIPEVIAGCQEVQSSGLLTSSHYNNVLMSMSGYEKPQDFSYSYRDAITRPDQASGYPAFAQPTYGSSFLPTHAQVPAGLPSAVEIPMLSSDNYHTHDTSYNHQNAAYSSFIAARPRHFPQVTSFTPAQGPAGRKLIVHLRSVDDLEAPPSPLFTVSFGSKRCNAMLAKYQTADPSSNYFLQVDVPPFDTTGSSTTQVGLYLDMNNGNTPSMPVEFGAYTYTDATAFPMSSPSQSSSRKRKLSLADGEVSPKRPAPLSLRPRNSLDMTRSSPHSAVAMSPYAPPHQAADMSYVQTPRMQQYHSLQGTPSYGTAQSQTLFGPYNGYLASDRSASGSGSANPPLVRTSALQVSPSSPTHASASFNPYTMYPSNSKAVLKLEGDLNSMVERWTKDEMDANRRLVRFRRVQQGSNINASFEPVTPEDHARAPGHIYVNCIYWAEKNACYITSVDTIQLLESLVAVRFTVEEKNRIRRNLEGFRPSTVSKVRPECEEFFKIIMGFPSPKPRNIEKDVKVFPWRILTHALKKIIGKYSASYASTAGALPPVATPASISGSSSGQHRYTGSPPSHHSSTSSVQYPSSMQTTLSRDLRSGVAMPMTGMGQQNMSWHQPSQNYTTEMSHGRPSWDFSSFLDNTSTMTAGTYQTQRIPSISQQLGLGGYYNMPTPPDYQRTHA